MTSLAWSLLAFSLIATALHLLTIGTVALRVVWRRRIPVSDVPSASLIRPMRGLTKIERRTLASSLTVRHIQDHHFCSERPNDPAVTFVEDLLSRHPGIDGRVLVGDNLSTANPKLNNIAKGWRLVQCEWVVIADSNLMMPPDCVERLMAAMRPGTGLVCAPPIGGEPNGFWSEVECAFLNTYQARWQYFADTCGLGFAQGKVMLWRRGLLDDAGGVVALASELAEDAAATKLVRATGLKVRLAEPSFVQPIGARTVQEVFARQARWAQLRRLSFPKFFAPEIFTGCVLPITAGAGAMVLMGGPAAALAAGLACTWIGAEYLLARVAGWHFSWRTPAALLMRDLLIPVVWIKGCVAGGYEWQGKRIITARSGAGETQIAGV